MQKILTIAVPAYNAEACIRKTIDSFGLPRFPGEIEVLVIDDGSTDRTGEIADRYAVRYPGTVRVFHKENGGHGSGINLGIRYAEGLYFKVVDADDWVDREAFARLMEVLRKQAGPAQDTEANRKGKPADIVYSGFRWAIQNENHPGRFRLKKPEQVPFRGVEFGRVYPFDEVADRIYIRMHNMTIRTALLREHGIRVDEACYYVDTEFITYPIPWVETVCFAGADVYLYRIGRRGQSVEIRQMRRNEKDYDRVADSLFGFYRELGREIPCPPARRNYICRILSRYVTGKMKIILSKPASKACKRQLMRFDGRLKRQYPAVYYQNRSLAAAVLRGSGYLAYRPVSRLVRWKYREW